MLVGIPPILLAGSGDLGGPGGGEVIGLLGSAVPYSEDTQYSNAQPPQIPAVQVAWDQLVLPGGGRSYQLHLVDILCLVIYKINPHREIVVSSLYCNLLCYLQLMG